MSELGGDAKIPDLWRMSAQLEFCREGADDDDGTLREGLSNERQ